MKQKLVHKEHLQNIALIIIAGIIIFSPLFKEGYPIFVDTPVHLAETYAFLDTFEKHTWITGWSYDDFAGYPLQQYRYPAGTWITALLHIITGISVVLSYKITLLLSYLFPAVALYVLLQRRFNAKAALLGAALFMFQQQILTKILAGVNNIYFAIGFLILYIDQLDIFLFKEKTTAKRAAILGILFACILFSHPYAALAGVLFSIIAGVRYLATKNWDAKNILHIAIIPVISFLIAAFYLMPLLETGSWTDDFIENKGIGDFLRTQSYVLFKAPENSSIANTLASFVPGTIIGILGIAGLLTFRKQKDNKNKDLLLCVLLFAIASAAITSGFWHYVPFLKSLPFAKGLIYSRFALYEIIALILLAAYALKDRTLPSRKIIATTFILLSIFVLCATDSKNYQTSTEQEVIPIENAWAWIQENSGNNSRTYYQTTASNVQHQLWESNILALSSYETGKQSLGVWFGGSIFPIERYILNLLSVSEIEKNKNTNYDKYIAEQMNLFNAQCVVSVTEELTALLSNSSLFEHKQSFEYVRIFCMKQKTDGWISFNNKTEYTVTTFDDWQFAANIHSNIENNTATIKIQYHPYWHAYIDGLEVQTYKNKEILIEIQDIPRGNHSLELQYKPIQNTHIVLSFVGVIIAIVLIWRKEK